MKKVNVVKSILNTNDAVAQKNRDIFSSHGILAINIMASPGSGKTSLILESIRRLKSTLGLGVIEGDLASTIDAHRIEEEQVPVVQINTGGGCHLDANLVSQAMTELPLDTIDILFMENIGNLVCPSGFALGEHKRIIISSVPEGDDKPIKYPIIFIDSDAVVINKIDLLPYLKFDTVAFKQSVLNVRPGAVFFEVSCTTGEGIDNWCNWLSEEHRKVS
jgi:hydrogenase nickel incorporation protein HypB